MSSFAKTLVVDSGFWFAFYNARDQYHTQAEQKASLLERMNLVIPWPSLYETFNSRFSKNNLAIRSFDSLLRQSHVVLLKDEPYREAALESAMSGALVGQRSMSLVDMVIRLIVEDTNVRKHGLLTFNRRDFSDVCRTHQIEIL